MNGEFESPREYRTKREERADIPMRSLRKKKSAEKSEAFLKILKIQIAICAIGVAAIFLISKVNSAAFDRMKADFSKITEKNMSIGEIIERVKTGAEYVIKPFDEAAAENSAVNDETGETVAAAAFTGEDSGGRDVEGKEAAKGTSFSSYKINAEPCMPVDSKRVTSPFGYRVNPVSGKYGFHTGIDLAAPNGSQVRTVFYGTVEETGEEDDWGKYVLIKHSDGLETYYCHLSEIYAEEGAVIRRGEVIGLSGSTGWSTGPHLHFEIRIGGIRVDPALLLFPDGYEA